jgi:CheY-like chemotaxis protein
MPDSPVKVKILVADDEALIVSVLRRFLEPRGYEVVGVFEGLEVLDRVRSEAPQIVLLDLRMPGRGGFEVLKDLRREFPKLPVIMTTASNDAADRSQALVLGACDFVTKPFDLHDVEMLMSQKLKRQEIPFPLHQADEGA